jgi:hypothetical protein
MSEAATAAVPEVRLRSLALPAEHGGWGMLGEAIVLGLAVAPSVAGAGVGLAALGAFLLHHPLKLAFADRVRGTRTARTVAAERFALVYATVAAVGLHLAAPRGAPGWWLPLGLAAPLVAIQLACETRHRGRGLVPELAGGIALSSVAAAAMLAAGWPLGPSLGASGILAARTAGAILYVRARIRLDRGLPSNAPAALGVHAAGLILATRLAAAGLAPWLATAGLASLLARCAHGLSHFRRPLRPQVLGMQEMAYGLLFTVVLIAGYRLGL